MTIFPKGEIIKNEYFTGTTWLKMLVSEDESFNCPIYNVSFEPGARNNWHKHPGGQILLVTDGKGYYQEEGKPEQIIQAGDIVRILPYVKHWHGAAKDTGLTHLAVSTNPQHGDIEWLEPVPDEAYNKLKQV